jgi:DNA-binding NarL/FixJ family response regulator
MNNTKVLIVDDHKAMRNGLAFLLHDLGNIDVVGQASNGKEFLDLLAEIKPDIVLMDINMPVMDGIEATRRALEMYPNLKILILSMYNDEEYYQTLIELGAKGFILKESDHDVIQRAIDSVMAGNSYFSQELILNLLRKSHEVRKIHLTIREKEVLKLICLGHSSAEIAEMLNVSTRTIEKSRSELMQKTETGNSIGLAIFAVKNKLVDI